MTKQFNVQSLINKSFNRSDYLRFIKTLFEIIPENQSLDVTGPYAEFINSGEYLGEYESNREKIYFYIVNLKGKSIERARVFQRDFIARDLRNHGAENALVVFYDNDQWRISFVKREKIEGKEQQLSAKRYSFFVGENEINNTCIQRINLLLKEEKPSIKQVEDAFSVEKVKDEFFKEYKSLFDKLHKEVKRLNTSDELIKKEFKEKNISEEDFSKKILGQIVFLYFLQKKGWLGVERDPVTRDFKEFGDGRQDFLQHLFEQAIKNGKNFFNDYLEKLFDKALADSSRIADHYEFDLEGEEWKIPFLNGGLFEPIGEYDWKKTDVKINNSVFKDILETFNKYNFTVREDEPMEKEVAIDPEMLGKVFENLLETKERKSTGSFYTPREIVHYMCQQSLINYLETKTKIKREVLEKFVTEDSSLKIPQEIQENSIEVDKCLREIKVVDPAVGSGAFLVGMMTEIVKARSLIDKEKKIFDLKEECIENNLHGVDISPGAVDICQLRLWLSLVVDEENYGNVKPLPNLDYKIMCGNSLIEDYKGMKLWDDKWIGIEKIKPDKQKQIKELDEQIKVYKSELPYLINKKAQKKKLEAVIRKLEKEKKGLMKRGGTNLTLTQTDSQRKLEILKGLHKKFTNINDRTEKQEYKKKIENATIELIKSKLKEEGKESEFEELKQIIQKKRAMPFFLWKMNFIDVFQRENPGFDVVIANPPYGLLNKKQNKSTGFKVSLSEIEYYKKSHDYSMILHGMINAFQLFIKKSIDILNQGGYLSQIFPLAFIGDVSSSRLRKYLLENYCISGIDAFPERDNAKKRVFEGVKMSVCIFGLSKKNEKNKFWIRIHDDKYVDLKNEKVYLDKEDIRLIDNKTYSFPLLKEKDFSIIKKMYDEPTIRFSDIGHCFTGEIDLTFHKKYLTKNPEKDPLIKGAIIGKYIIKKKMSQGEIEYLDSFGYKKNNTGPKSTHHENARIVLQAITGVNEKERLKMALIGEGVFCANSVNYLVFHKNVKPKYILAVFNSSLINFLFRKTSTNSNVNGYEIDNLPIRFIDDLNQKPFIEKVDQILNITKDEDYLTNDSKKEKVKEIEKEIDEMVYKLYELTPEEIKIVEGFGKNG